MRTSVSLGCAVFFVAAHLPLSADAAPQPCSPDQKASCLYKPAQSYEFGITTFLTEVSYKDALGQSRIVPIAVYRPQGTPLPAPVVLLSHGGSNGKTDPKHSLSPWARAIAGGGYVAVAIAHDDRSPADYNALCEHLKVSKDIPCAIKINWDRPYDVRAVLDWLESQSTKGSWLGSLDLSRIAHVGHSAGAGAAQMLGGLPRNFVCSQPFGRGQEEKVACAAKDFVSRRDPRIDAIIALSPIGPGTEGFTNESFASLAVPLFMATGTNDGDAGEPETRLAAWDLYPAGERWKMYIDDPGAQHTLFQGETDTCAEAADAGHCIELRRSLFATGLAFLDTQLRSDQDARKWLGSGRVETLSGGATTLVGK